MLLVALLPPHRYRTVLHEAGLADMLPPQAMDAEAAVSEHSPLLDGKRGSKQGPTPGCTYPRGWYRLLLVQPCDLGVEKETLHAEGTGSSTEAAKLGAGVTVMFRLPAGSFATMCLRELVGYDF